MTSNNKTSHDSETKAVGKQVITACAFIHQNFNGIEKIFLPKRAATKKFLPGVFELPGGHINFGEDIKEGLKREVMEEFGVKIKVGDSFYVFTYENKVKGSHSIEVDYYATFKDPLEKIKLNPEDHSEFIWASEDEISDIMKRDSGEEDPEVIAIKKGFQLLKGNSLNFS